jgi:hypothetical protein
MKNHFIHFILIPIYREKDLEGGEKSRYIGTSASGGNALITTHPQMLHSTTIYT